jgi:glyoxylase-like metal-dependent hydrolase (beta-lactamase superfamily II)
MTRVIRVLAPNPGSFTLEGTNTWLVGEDPAVVIDPGPDDAGHILAVLEEARSVGAVLLTHRHPDHAPGAARLAEAARAPVLAFEPRDGARRLAEGETVSVEDGHLRVIHTPGHAPDHVSLLLQPEGLLFTGDTVLGRGTSVVDPPEGDMAAYVSSLQHLRRLGARSIYPGHGPVVFDATAKLDEYLAHRGLRERQILAALAGGPRTAAEIVPDVYRDEVPDEMRPAAARSVLAHLLKLERERRVTRAGSPRDERFALVTPKACQRCGRPALPGSKYCGRCGLAVLQETPEAVDLPPADPGEK